MVGLCVQWVWLNVTSYPLGRMCNTCLFCVCVCVCVCVCMCVCDMCTCGVCVCTCGVCVCALVCGVCALVCVRSSNSFAECRCVECVKTIV